MATITINGVSFTNIPNKRLGLQMSLGLTQSNVPESGTIQDYIESEHFYKLVHALDIDWDGMQVDENVIINDTADLINWLKSLPTKGDKGDTGEQGPQGIQGPQGETGPLGEKGDTGAQGLCVRFYEGVLSSQVNGYTNLNGIDGWKLNDIIIASNGMLGVVSSIADNQASVISKCSLVGPQGATGSQGPKGETGEQGPKGDTGTVDLSILGNITKIDSNQFDYIYDEASWNASFQNGALKKYYTRWPDEDRYNQQAHRWAWEADKVNGEWPDYCVQCWEGAISADGAQLPWICPNFDTDVNARIIFSYEGKKDVRPWGFNLFGIGRKDDGGDRLYGVASVAREFKDNSFLIPQLKNGNEIYNSDSNWSGTAGDKNFDVSKFKMYLYTQDSDNTVKGYVDEQVKYLLGVINDLENKITELKNGQ